MSEKQAGEFEAGIGSLQISVPVSRSIETLTDLKLRVEFLAAGQQSSTRSGAAGACTGQCGAGGGGRRRGRRRQVGTGCRKQRAQPRPDSPRTVDRRQPSRRTAKCRGRDKMTADPRGMRSSHRSADSGNQASRILAPEAPAAAGRSRPERMAMSGRAADPWLGLRGEWQARNVLSPIGSSETCDSGVATGGGCECPVPLHETQSPGPGSGSRSEPRR